MSRILPLFAVLSSLLLAGCGSPFVAASIARAAGEIGPPVVKPAAGAPQIYVTLLSGPIKFPMSLLDRDGANSIWAASDGVQIFLRNGMLVGTRGLGRDLMSAQVPNPSTIAAKTVHDRTYFDLDGADRMIRYDFTCQAQNAPPGSEFAGTQHFVEACTGTFGTIKNHYWIDRSGNVQKSVQWVSETVGYLATAPADPSK